VSQLLNVGSMEEINTESYEELLRLSELIPPVSKGADSNTIQSLPCRKYNKDTDKDNKCNICLCDYEEDEDLLSLPSCLHCFHKECIIKWLEINKICPICRLDITK